MGMGRSPPDRRTGILFCSPIGDGIVVRLFAVTAADDFALDVLLYLEAL